jgi:hypothetical protein
MQKGKRFVHDDDGPKIILADLFEEVKAEYLAKAIDWSGRDIVATPELAEKINSLLLGNRELTKIVLGISVQSGMPPPMIHNTITTGFIMGVSMVIEMLNVRGNGSEFSDIAPGSDTIQ